MSFQNSPRAAAIARRAAALLGQDGALARDDIVQRLLIEDGGTWDDRGHDYQAVVGAVMRGDRQDV